MFAWIRFFIVLFIVQLNANVFAKEVKQVELAVPPAQSTVGSWTFSGLVTTESNDKYGYFFTISRQVSDFHVKAALIDGQTNELVFFYEGEEKLENPTSFDWHIGLAFIRYNPINESWVFGVKTEEKKGFNFKVDLLKQANTDTESLVLRPGVNLQALQTSQLNGHVQIDDKEQFVTGNKTWFGKLVLNDAQKEAHDINTLFCRLNDDNGFYSANLKEKDATSAAVAGWFDPMGKKVKMSQFITITPLKDDQSTIKVAWPKLSLSLMNTLKSDKLTHSIAGFSKGTRGGFCYMAKQSFVKEEAQSAHA